MKTLVVGGSGLIGGHIALHLAAQGHAITIASRSAPPASTALATLPFIAGSYLNPDDFPPEQLTQFDTMIFCAGQDIRHLPQGENDSYWDRTNSHAVPEFFARARAAGIRRALNLGSFYPQVRPSLIETNAYVRSRHLADRGVVELAAPEFFVVSVNAPFVLGAVPGLTVPMFDYLTKYARGMLPLPPTAPPGGVNFITTHSLSQAVAGALARGTSGKSYLVGDENMTFRDFFAAFFKAAGNQAEVLTVDENHPLLPDSAIYAGRGTLLYYEPDPGETALLGYDRHDVMRAIAEIIAQ